KNGEHLPLTAKEHEILSVLCRNAGRIVTIDQLCEAAWGENPFGYENSLMAHIRRIREKIEKNPSKPVSLITVKGLGYKLVMEERCNDEYCKADPEICGDFDTEHVSSVCGECRDPYSSGIHSASRHRSMDDSQGDGSGTAENGDRIY